MTWWRILLARARALVLPQRVRDEIDEELQFHLDMRARDNERQGMPETDARHAAARTFGSVSNIKEVSYDIRGGGWIEAVWRDFTYARRSVLKQRALSSAVIGIVATGIGVNAAILGVADHVLWRTLPVHAPHELEQITLAHDYFGMSYPMYDAIRRDTIAFSAVFARWRQAGTFTIGAGDPERRVVEMVSGNYFNTLGLQPSAGRLISENDDRTIMAHAVVVISDRYWRTRLNARESAIGRTIIIDDYPFTIIGVAPPTFFGIEVGVSPDAWVPLAMHPVVFSAHRSLVDDRWMWLEVFGRRRAELTTAAAESRATIVVRRFQKAHADGDTVEAHIADAKLVSAARGVSPLRSRLELPLDVLIGIVAFVLVVACANVGTLVAARSLARAREIGVRLALGASRGRVIRQLLMENLLLATAGGVAGTILAIGVSRGLLRLLPPASLPSEINVAPDARVLVIALALSTITGILFGVAPALRAVRLDVARVIRDDTHSLMRGRRKPRVRSMLVAGQVAMSLVLVTGAGLFAKSVERLATTPPGFDAQHVLMATISPTLNRYTERSALTLYRALQSRLAATPGVRSVATSGVPILGGPDNYNITTMHWSGQHGRGDPLSLLTHTVSGDFFTTTGAQIIRGRGLDDRDVGPGPIAIVLNETAARRYFDDVDPVGKTVRLMGSPAVVVGLVRDSKYRTMREQMPQILYSTFEQDSFARVSLERTLYVRTTGDPSAFVPTLASTVRELDRSLPLFDVRTLAEQQRRSMATERALAFLSTVAASIALLLAAIGLYGLVTFDTQQRTREIGVRISLGATESGIIAMVLRGAVALLVMGGVAGLAISRGLAKLITAQLYGVNAGDPVVTLAACAVLAAAVFLAASLPAWRAARVNPTEALRCD